MVAAPAHQRNQKRPRTSSNAVPEPLSNLSVLAHWFHQSIRRGFRGQRVLLGFLILGAGHAVYGVIARARPFGTGAAERRGHLAGDRAQILTSLKRKRRALQFLE